MPRRWGLRVLVALVFPGWALFALVFRQLRGRWPTLRDVPAYIAVVGGMLLAAVAVVMVLGLLLVVGGGGGGEETVAPTSTPAAVPTSTPTPVPTPTPIPTEVQDQLRRMVLHLEDFPSGVILAEDFLVTAEQSAAESADREGRLARLKEWGYIQGYDVTYQANPQVQSEVGLILANSTASLYGSKEGARASFADAVETARTTDWAALFGGAQEVEDEEIASPPLTDEMLWLRITAKAEREVGIEEQTFAQDVILFRQGPARGSLMVAWAMDDGSSDFVQQLAEAQAQNLKDALLP